MDEQEIIRQMTSLQLEVNQLKALMQRLLFALLTNERDRYSRLQSLFQELRVNSETSTTDTDQELAAIRQELQAGNKLKAISLYRVLYNVSLIEAQDAINKMQR